MQNTITEEITRLADFVGVVEYSKFYNVGDELLHLGDDLWRVIGVFQQAITAIGPYNGTGNGTGVVVTGAGTANVELSHAGTGYKLGDIFVAGQFAYRVVNVAATVTWRGEYVFRGVTFTGFEASKSVLVHKLAKPAQVVVQAGAGGLHVAWTAQHPVQMRHGFAANGGVAFSEWQDTPGSAAEVALGPHTAPREMKVQLRAAAGQNFAVHDEPLTLPALSLGRVEVVSREIEGGGSLKTRLALRRVHEAAQVSTLGLRDSEQIRFRRQGATSWQSATMTRTTEDPNALSVEGILLDEGEPYEVEHTHHEQVRPGSTQEVSHAWVETVHALRTIPLPEQSWTLVGTPVEQPGVLVDAQGNALEAALAPGDRILGGVDRIPRSFAVEGGFRDLVLVQGTHTFVFNRSVRTSALNTFAVARVESAATRPSDGNELLRLKMPLSGQQQVAGSVELVAGDIIRFGNPNQNDVEWEHYRTAIVVGPTLGRVTVEDGARGGTEAQVLMNSGDDSMTLNEKQDAFKTDTLHTVSLGDLSAEFRSGETLSDRWLWISGSTVSEFMGVYGVMMTPSITEGAIGAPSEVTLDIATNDGRLLEEGGTLGAGRAHWVRAGHPSTRFVQFPPADGGFDPPSGSGWVGACIPAGGDRGWLEGKVVRTAREQFVGGGKLADEEPFYVYLP